MNRRNFLQTFALAASASPLLTPSRLLLETSRQKDLDEVLCNEKFELAISKGWEKLPIGEVVVLVGKTFLGTPYAEHILEVPGPEHLVVNMRALDCVTFYENALVIARCIKEHKTTFENYKKELQFVRYRGGVLDGYASRLHYTSDYFYDGEKKGIWKLLAKDLGGVPFKKKLDFMSVHPDSYWQIRESEKVRKRIEEIENEVSSRTMYYLPKERVAAVADKIHDGDILGMTTSIEGIDTSHTGIALWQNKQLHLMHAPLSGKEVTVSENPLPEYLELVKRMTGIMVARPLEPVRAK